MVNVKTYITDEQYDRLVRRKRKGKPLNMLYEAGQLRSIDQQRRITPKPTPAPKPSTDPLWNQASAKNVHNIDLSQYGRVKTLTQAPLAFTLKEGNRVFRIVNPEVRIAIDVVFDATFTDGVCYFCSNTGKVYDYCISSMGASREEAVSVFTPGDFPGDLYIVLASKNTEINALFLKHPW